MEYSTPVLRDLSADDPEISEIESLCMNCHEQGITRMLLTRIPFFRDVIVSSFKCEECNYTNTELIPATTIQEKGVEITLKVTQKQDLDRQMVITGSCSLEIPELELVIPPSKGALTTIEGVLQKTCDELAFHQPVRKAVDAEAAEKIDNFIGKVKSYQKLENVFTLIANDPSGNSHIENPNAPQRDPSLTIVHYERTSVQNISLGMQADDVEKAVSDTQKTNTDDKTEVPEEVMTFPSNCSSCQAVVDVNMKTLDIPHFKNVIIMATNCDNCGLRDNEVKSGGGIEPHGLKITLKLTDVADLSRDVLNSATCSFSIPELQFETDSGTLGGRFTTIEGLLKAVKNQLRATNPFLGSGDSQSNSQKSKLQKFCDQLDEVIDGKRLGIHFIIDDPAGNSYIQNYYAPEDDPEMKVEKYTRNYEQNDILGLNDMNTENYHNEEVGKSEHRC
ncbi:zinc finger protein ZPR1-like isoform X2 [Tubulanus polymorphus]